MPIAIRFCSTSADKPSSQSLPTATEASLDLAGPSVGESVDKAGVDDLLKDLDRDLPAPPHKEGSAAKDDDFDDLMKDIDKDLDGKGLDKDFDKDLGADLDKDFKMTDKELEEMEKMDMDDKLPDFGDDDLGDMGGNNDPRQTQRALKSLMRDFGEVHERAKLPLQKYEMHILRQVDTDDGGAVSLYELDQKKLNAFCEPLGFNGAVAAVVFEAAQEFGLQRGATFDNKEKLSGAKEVEAYVIFHCRNSSHDPEAIRAVVKAAIEEHNRTDPPPAMDDMYGGSKEDTVDDAPPFGDTATSAGSSDVSETEKEKGTESAEAQPTQRAEEEPQNEK